MKNSQKIRMALAYINKSEAWLAKSLGTTPQAFNQRMKTDKFTLTELEKIASVLDANYVANFKFKDGTII